MPETFLHGVEVLELNDGPRPIRSVRSSVIGLVGSGNGGGVAASVELGTGNGRLKFTADAEGVAGNGIRISSVVPPGSNVALSVAVVGNAITITQATGATAAVPISTGSQVLAAVNAHAAASALVTAELATGSNGSATYGSPAQTFLSGGVDPAFPLDTPVLLTSPRDIDATVGANTYLGHALEAIFKQAGAVVVVVRTDDVEGDATDLTGVFALKRAQANLGFTPRIIVAENAWGPGAIGSVKSVAASLRAVAVVGLNAFEPFYAATDATAWVTANANDRVMAYWPSVNGGEDPAPFIAGAMAKSDNDRGFWWSPSNIEIFGIESLDAPVDFQLGDTTSLANILNEGNVSTFIRQGGFRAWGNRTGSIDPKWAFVSVRRTADIINDSILRAHLWAVDRNITKTYLEDVTESVNGYLRSLQNQGAILGGKCWPDPDLNSPANITQGKVFFNFDFTPPYPAEHITFRSQLVNDYITDLV